MALSTALWLATAPIAVVVALASLVLGAARFDASNPLLATGLWTAAVLALLYRARFAYALARVLCGASPLGTANAPSTQDELVDAVRRVFEENAHKPPEEARPQIVGCGWGYYLCRRAARRAVFTHRLRGRPDATNHPLRFYAGTTIAEVCACLHATRKKTFWSTPTHQQVSIGSWLARSCHGNGGPSGFPSSHAASTVLVLHIETAATAARGVQTFAYKQARAWFDADPDDWVIVAVEFSSNRLAPSDLLLQKRMVTVPKHETRVTSGLSTWLSDDAVLRVLFFGSARPKCGIGVTYTQVPNRTTAVKRRLCCGVGCEVDHIDPHFGSTACMSMQLDTCSLLGGWHETDPLAWRGITTLKHANAFSPSSLLNAAPFAPLVIMWTGLLNFEFIFVLRRSVEGGRAAREKTVQTLCNALINVFTGPGPVWGRCEVRMGDLARGILFLDISARESDAAHIVKAIAPFVHARQIALHTSKYRSRAIAGYICANGLEESSPLAVYALGDARGSV